MVQPVNLKVWCTLCSTPRPNSRRAFLPQEYLQKEHPGLRGVIAKCGGRYHVINNRQQQNREQVQQLLEKVRSCSPAVREALRTTERSLAFQNCNVI